MQSKIKKLHIPLNNFKKNRLSRKTVLALGPELKSNYTLIDNGLAKVFLGFGDLKDPDNFSKYKRHILKTLKNLKNPTQIITCDLNPVYLSTQFAHTLQSGVLKKSKLMSIQHHYAHVLSGCASLNLMKSPVLGIVCDGTGLGLNNKVWGCEFIRYVRDDFSRLGHLNYIPLPGSDYAVWEPWRVGVALLYQAFGDKINNLDLALLRQPGEKVNLLIKMIKSGFNTPLASSAGRLFDGVSAIINLLQKIEFEAQASIMLEQKAEKVILSEKGKYPYRIEKKGRQFILNSNDLVRAIVKDVRAAQSKEIIAARFHNTFADMLINTSKKILNQKENNNICDIILCGGVFLNKIILKKVTNGLEKCKFKVHKPESLILSDAGLSLGQAVIGYVFGNSRKG